MKQCFDSTYSGVDINSLSVWLLLVNEIADSTDDLCRTFSLFRSLFHRIEQLLLGFGATSKAFESKLSATRDNR